MAEQIDPKTYQKLEYMVDFKDTLNEKPKEVKSNYREGKLEIIDCSDYPLNRFKTEEYKN